MCLRSALKLAHVGGSSSNNRNRPNLSDILNDDDSFVTAASTVSSNCNSPSMSFQASFHAKAEGCAAAVEAPNKAPLRASKSSSVWQARDRAREFLGDVLDIAQGGRGERRGVFSSNGSGTIAQQLETTRDPGAARKSSESGQPDRASVWDLVRASVRESSLREKDIAREDSAPTDDDADAGPLQDSSLDVGPSFLQAASSRKGYFPKFSMSPRGSTTEKKPPRFFSSVGQSPPKVAPNGGSAHVHLPSLIGTGMRAA